MFDRQKALGGETSRRMTTKLQTSGLWRYIFKPEPRQNTELTILDAEVGSCGVGSCKLEVVKLEDAREVGSCEVGSCEIGGCEVGSR